MMTEGRGAGERHRHLSGMQYCHIVDTVQSVTIVIGVHSLKIQHDRVVLGRETYLGDCQPLVSGPWTANSVTG